MTDLAWRVSSYTDNGSCVEVAELPDGGRAVRNSNHREAGTIHFNAAEWDAFIKGVKANEFD